MRFLRDSIQIIAVYTTLALQGCHSTEQSSKELQTASFNDSGRVASPQKSTSAISEHVTADICDPAKIPLLYKIG